MLSQLLQADQEDPGVDFANDAEKRDASVFLKNSLSGTFNKTQQLWNTAEKECYAVYKSVPKFAFYLADTDSHCIVTTNL